MLSHILHQGDYSMASKHKDLCIKEVGYTVAEETAISTITWAGDEIDARFVSPDTVEKKFNLIKHLLRTPCCYRFNFYFIATTRPNRYATWRATLCCLCVAMDVVASSPSEIQWLRASSIVRKPW